MVPGVACSQLYVDGVDDNEVVCPLCKAVCNLLVPRVDFREPTAPLAERELYAAQRTFVRVLATDAMPMAMLGAVALAGA